MPKYRFHVLPEDGLDDIELRFADDYSAMQTAEVVLREEMLRLHRSGAHLRKVIEVVRSDGTTAGFVEIVNSSLTGSSSRRGSSKNAHLVALNGPEVGTLPEVSRGKPLCRNAKD